MKKQTLKKMWVCQCDDLLPDLTTIARNRESSIQLLLRYFKDSDDWDFCQAIGWKCFKVDITFEPCSPETP